MREIKFRLIEHGKIVGYERWNSIAGKWCYDTKADGVFDIRNPFIPHTDKDQYIGLKDKNVQEIYERDRVRWHTYDGYIADSIVEFRNGYFYPIADGCLEYQRFDQEQGFEVIGNVWENPELLRGGQADVSTT